MSSDDFTDEESNCNLSDPEPDTPLLEKTIIPTNNTAHNHAAQSETNGTQNPQTSNQMEVLDSILKSKMTTLADAARKIREIELRQGSEFRCNTLSDFEKYLRKEKETMKFTLADGYDPTRILGSPSHASNISSPSSLSTMTTPGKLTWINGYSSAGSSRNSSPLYNTDGKSIGDYTSEGSSSKSASRKLSPGGSHGRANKYCFVGSRRRLRTPRTMYFSGVDDLAIVQYLIKHNLCHLPPEGWKRMASKGEEGIHLSSGYHNADSLRGRFESITWIHLEEFCEPEELQRFPKPTGARVKRRLKYENQLENSKWNSSV